MDETFNLDILEILLSETYQMSHVLNGLLTSKLRYITETHYGGKSYYDMDMIFRHGSLHALEPELLKPIYNKLYIPDNEWKDAITDALTNVPINIPKTCRNDFLYGVNWEVVKYSHIDFNLLQHNNTLYNKLYTQTNSFDHIELGKRVILLPGKAPENYDDFIKAYEPLTREFKIVAKYLEQTYYLDRRITDAETMNEEIRLRFCSDVEQIKREIVEDLEVFNTGTEQEDESELTMAMLEKYREKYEACIIVKPEYTRLYTRARFILNTFIDTNLNESLIKYIVKTSPFNSEDTISRAYEFLGLNARHILTYMHTLYLDQEGFPVFSNLYLFGSIENRLFPESINFTDIQTLCYCKWCNPFLYTARLYESSTGEVYVLVNLKSEPENFLKDLINKKCYYNLFLYDIDYHYRRIAALADWRNTLEIFRHKRLNFNLEYVNTNYGLSYQDWFSSSHKIQRNVLNIEEMLKRTQYGY